MFMERETFVNICQPGHNASCALCCGSHNYRLPRDELHQLFRARRDLYRRYREHNTADSRAVEGIMKDTCRKKLMPDGIQCSMVGVIDKKSGRIGCLCYNEPGEYTPFEPFFSATCKTFICPASDILSNEEIIFAAKLTADWYYYSMLINDIEYLRKLNRVFGSPERVSSVEMREIREHLEGNLYHRRGQNINYLLT